jgi:ABC-2 type transport system ATP-binding protein
VLLLLDEPTTGLDPRSKREVQDFIREIRVTHDSTVLLCTHDLAEAESLADRVGILDRGRLIVIEPPDVLIRRYGAGSLEDAFFRATGRDLGPEDPEGDNDEDDEREVFG